MRIYVTFFSTSAAAGWTLARPLGAAKIVAMAGPRCGCQADEIRRKSTPRLAERRTHCRFERKTPLQLASRHRTVPSGLQFLRHFRLRPTLGQSQEPDGQPSAWPLLYLLPKRKAARRQRLHELRDGRRPAEGCSVRPEVFV